MLDLGGLRAGTGGRTAPLPVAPVEKRQSRLGRWFDNWLRSVGMAVILFVIIKTFLVEAFQIPSGSMERTLLAGDFLFVNKAVYGAQIPGTKARLPGFESPRRGGGSGARNYHPTRDTWGPLVVPAGGISCWGTTATTRRIPATGASSTPRRSRDGRSSCISATTGRRTTRCPG